MRGALEGKTKTMHGSPKRWLPTVVLSLLVLQRRLPHSTALAALSIKAKGPSLLCGRVFTDSCTDRSGARMRRLQKAPQLAPESKVVVKEAKKPGRCPAWADGLLFAASLALCSLAEPFVGPMVSGWAAVTVCVVSQLQTDWLGRAALKGCLWRLVGTAVGFGFALIFGRSWLAMSLLGGSMALVRRQVGPSQGYACVVTSLTYSLVALGGGRDVAQRTTEYVLTRGSRRLEGVFIGCAALASCLAVRWVMLRLWMRYEERWT
eukprot:TRINITY_DN29067_c0_g1_i1.p1 TRINITY_DN29067_c0_g1~~TRINITY_DN29067_c0_g1_i1.p1  ORF type:complete len:263 (+),score=27.87 TRINITY_DN29067_c0_g1_i1:134-922(+)